MGTMEGTMEMNQCLEEATEAPHLRLKETDQSSEPHNGANNAENFSALVTEEHSWPEQLSIDALSVGPRSLDCAGVMVEELTLKNYRNPNLSSGGDSPKEGTWVNFMETLGGPKDLLKEVGRVGAENMFTPHLLAKKNQPHPQRDLPNTRVSEIVAAIKKKQSSARNACAHTDGILSNALESSGFGFAHFFAKTTTLKGKGITHQEHSDRNSDRVAIGMEIATDTSCESTKKRGDSTTVGSSCGVMGAGDGISLREWLGSSRHKPKDEVVHIFRQVAEFIDVSHTQGKFLQHLRPSHFVMVPTHKVKYTGALVLKDQEEHSRNLTLKFSKRKKHVEQDTGAQCASLKYPRHVKQNAAFGEVLVIDDGLDGRLIKEGPFNSRFQQKHWGISGSQKAFKHPTAFSTNQQHLVSENLRLEETWYASPEEMHDISCCPFASNVYSLGVLLFELFCQFESSDMHSSAMSDLRYRILPPKFLQENPKEAGFCLWLLHPEPSLRPKSRDVLLCDLVSEGSHLSFHDHSTILIDEEDAEAELLVDFLLELKEEKEKQAAKLSADLGILRADIDEVERRRPPVVCSFPDLADQPFSERDSRSPMVIVNQERLTRAIDQLEKAYFSMRSKIESHETSVLSRPDEDVLKIHDKKCRIQNDGHMWDRSSESNDRLGAFFEGLCKYARYTKFEVRGILRNRDILNPVNVICSLSFDRDEDFFATAGVSKKIKIFEFKGLMNDIVDIHYPVTEMSSRSKLSWVCWNSYIKNYLASTDYEGVVQLWDANTGQGINQYVEHQKRAWSVDFSHVDPTKLASGSDDCSVKLWTINEKNCIDTIRNIANICCVQFSPHSSHLLSFGSADYKVYCYDLRFTRIPWCTLAGHNKAVSYVKFVDPETIVSASTDSTLKIWDLKKTNLSGLSLGACSVTLCGHTNERNFVGLTHSEGFIACGSETNEVYAYYRGLPMPIASHKFGSIDPITGLETGDGHGQFVSSVCWRGKSGMILAANSSGSIKLLQMV